MGFKRVARNVFKENDGHPHFWEKRPIKVRGGGAKSGRERDKTISFSTSID